MSISQGGRFTSYLDLPFEVSRRLSSDGSVDLGEWMCEHVQEVLDALVTVGALEVSIAAHCERDRNHYVVVTPHTHEWHVIQSRPASVVVECACGQMRDLSNTLPIKVPLR